MHKELQGAKELRMAKNSLPHGRAHQLTTNYQHQVASPEKIPKRNIIQTAQIALMYLGIYKYGYITTIKGKRD